MDGGAINSSIDAASEQIQRLESAPVVLCRDRPKQQSETQPSKEGLDASEELESKRVLAQMRARFRRRATMLSEGSGLSMGASSTKTRRLTIENVAQILQKAPSSRLPAEYETVLDYMVKDLEFFRRPNDQASAGRNARVALTREQQMQLCEAMQCKYYGKGEELTVYGTKGDRFYIILEGVVSVKIPLPKEL